MFKRANKITSLLVAAAAVASLVPVTGVYAADAKKIDSQDGTVYNAVAYKDGTAYIDGEVNNTDAAYYYKDGKYTELADVDSGSSVEAFGTKYAKIDDGKDYNVDLENGKVIDDDQPSNDEDDAASALRKKTKDGDRYDATNFSAPSSYKRDVTADLTVISGSKFVDNWYSTKLYTANGQFADVNTTSTNVYTDMKGNFIDADYNLGKVKVETTSGASKGSVTIENTKDTYKLTDKGAKNTWAAVSGQKLLGQDKDYIYRIAKITINTDATGVMEVNGKEFNVVNGQIAIDVIQKISKKQDSGDVDDGKYAANVYNYFLTGDDGKSATKATAYEVLANLSGSKAQFINGKLVIYNVTDADQDDNVKIQAATLKQKNGYYYTDVESDANKKAEYSTKTSKTAIDTDVDGNIYILDSGYVKKFDGTDDWTKIDKVDGSFDSLSVYDKDSMVAWSQADEVYSVIGGKDAAKDKDAKDGTDVKPATPVVVTASGWNQAADKTWTYVKVDGTKATGWLQLGDTWYYLNANGVMATGWKQLGDTWYYLNGSGAMATGWVQVGADWYYCNASGAMLANTTQDGYTLGASGAWVR